MSRKAMSVLDLVQRGMDKAVEVGECLEWQGAFSCSGVTPCVKSREGKSYTAAHPVCRLLWEQANGLVPEGKLVYRKCCNNACVKLEHLRCGTRADWKANQKRNGKTKHATATKLKITASSRRRPNVVNTLEKAREVRALKAEKLTYREISIVTGVSEGMVADIVQGSAWRETLGNPFALLGARA
jgi:hypothetical protein